MFVILPFYFVVIFKSFSTRKCFDLFQVIFLFKLFSLSSKSLLFTKSSISPLVAKFVCFSFAVKFSAVNLLNAGLLIYLLWSSILFSTAVRAVVVHKLVILGIWFLT